MYLNIIYGCTARFVSDLVRNPEDVFCREAAQLIITLYRLQTLHVTQGVNRIATEL